MEIQNSTYDKRRRNRMSYETAFALNGPNKIPPQAIDIEESVLGALMLDENALVNTIEVLHVEYFYKQEHQLIFKAIRSLFEHSKQVDLLTVTEQLNRDGNLKAAGGAYFVSQLTNRVASAAHVEYHARILSEKYMQREMIRISTELLHKAYDDTVDVLDLLDDAEGDLMDITEKNIHSDYQSIDDVMHEALEQINNAQNSEGSVSGVPSGYTDLDAITAGFHPGTLIVLAARPGMGKTAFALSIARNMAVDYNRPVAFFSLEMPAVDLVMRLISSETEISSETLKKGEKLQLWQRELLNAKTELLRNAPIYIDDTSQLTIFELRAKCRRLKQRYKIEMVFIDYLQLMQAGSDLGRGSNREQEISTISRQLKSLSKELKIPIMAMAQLSRDVEKRGGNLIPRLSDLRESGAIEQDADIVAFVHRPEYYGNTEPDTKGPVAGMADIILAKHRSGATGECRLRFRKEFTRFENLVRADGGSADLPANANFDSSFAPQTITVPSRINSDNDLQFGSTSNEDVPDF